MLVSVSVGPAGLNRAPYRSRARSFAQVGRGSGEAPSEPGNPGYPAPQRHPRISFSSSSSSPRRHAGARPTDLAPTRASSNGLGATRPSQPQVTEIAGTQTAGRADHIAPRSDGLGATRPSQPQVTEISGAQIGRAAGGLGRRGEGPATDTLVDRVRAAPTTPSGNPTIVENRADIGPTNPPVLARSRLPLLAIGGAVVAFVAMAYAFRSGQKPSDVPSRFVVVEKETTAAEIKLTISAMMATTISNSNRVKPCLLLLASFAGCMGL